VVESIVVKGLAKLQAIGSDIQQVYGRTGIALLREVLVLSGDGEVAIARLDDIKTEQVIIAVSVRLQDRRFGHFRVR
jgi:hypothetical protein